MVLQIVLILLDMAAASQGISMLIDWLFLVCSMLCKFMTCLLCFTKKTVPTYLLCHTLSLYHLLCFFMAEELCVILTAVPFVLRP